MVAGPARVECDVRLVFVTPQRASLVLDAIVSSPASELGALGWPVSIEVERPKTARFDELIEQLLVRWAREARVVNLALVSSKPCSQARLDSDGAIVCAHLVRLG